MSTLSFDRWRNLLQESIDSDQYIFYKEIDHNYFLADKSFTSNHSHKLSLNQIIDITRSFSGQDTRISRKVAAVLEQMAQKAEEKSYYQGSSCFGIFNCLINCLTFQGIGISPVIAQKLATELLFPKPIEYKKGERKTQDIVPTAEKLGEGASGRVYIHAEDNTLAVKKSQWNIEKEYGIGLTLDHPFLVKHHQLFIKKDPSGKMKYLMVMDRIAGHSIQTIRNEGKKISYLQLLSLLPQFKECCLYLYNQNIVWDDVNNGNIFITEDNHLKICDFGRWSRENDPIQKTTSLLIRAKNIVGLLLSYSSFRKAQNADEKKQLFIIENSIMEPKDILDGHGNFTSETKTALNAEDSRFELLNNYFEAVIFEIKNQSEMFEA